MGKFPYTGSDSALTGDYSKALRSMLERAFVRAPKGFGVQAKRLWSKWATILGHFVYIFYYS